MSAAQWLTLALLATLVFWMLGAYNRLVALRAAIGAAWVQLDEVLQGRVATGTALAERQHGASLHAGMLKVQQAAETLRQRPAAAERAAALAAAESALGQTLAACVDALGVAAPDELAAYQALQQPLDFARQLFNQAVARYNAALAEFPTRLIARIFGFAPAGML